MRKSNKISKKVPFFERTRYTVSIVPVIWVGFQKADWR